VAVDITAYAYELPAEADYEFRQKRIQLGDGYEQRATDGINTIRPTWQVRFPAFGDTAVAGLPNNNLADLKAALLDVEPVLWQSPEDSSAVAYDASEIKIERRSDGAPGISEIRCRLRRVFEKS